MRRKKICIRPKLNDRGGNLQQSWYIELSMRNPETGEMVRKRYFEFDNLNINKFVTTSERYSEANKIIKMLDKKIDAGWTIFNDVSRCIYEDQLQYSHAASVYKKQFSENNTFKYWIGQYIKEKFVDLSDGTTTTYTSRYRRFGLFLEAKQIQSFDIKAIDNNVVIGFFNYLKLEGELSSRTYHSYIDLLTTFFDWLYNKGEI